MIYRNKSRQTEWETEKVTEKSRSRVQAEFSLVNKWLQLAAARRRHVNMVDGRPSLLSLPPQSRKKCWRNENKATSLDFCSLSFLSSLLISLLSVLIPLVCPLRSDMPLPRGDIWSFSVRCPSRKRTPTWAYRCTAVDVGKRTAHYKRVESSTDLWPFSISSLESFVIFKCYSDELEVFSRCNS